MELEAQVDQDFAGADDGKIGAGLKHWAIFAVSMMKWPLALFSELRVQPLSEIFFSDPLFIVFNKE